MTDHPITPPPELRRQRLSVTEESSVTDQHQILAIADELEGK